MIHQSELDQSNGRWICENTGMWTRDGLTFFSAADNEIPPPRSITFHIWTAYSPFTTWVQIVYDWLDALKDPNGLKTFVNTTLGETWEEAVGEKLDHQVLMDKVVHYTAAVPARVVYLTAGIDSQRNRFEMYVWGWAPGEKKLFWWIKSSLWAVPMRKRRCYVWMRRSTKNTAMQTEPK